ncbi:hypothetical protein SLE2022_387430 [Rubroshorea leprosula]
MERDAGAGGAGRHNRTRKANDRLGKWLRERRVVVGDALKRAVMVPAPLVAGRDYVFPFSAHLVSSILFLSLSSLKDFELGLASKERKKKKINGGVVISVENWRCAEDNG